MSLVSMQTLAQYWSAAEVETNLIIFMNLLGALLLGLLVGYERSYHGRAAGMRTYGLVCMASAALTVLAGYPQHWFGGLLPGAEAGDPTRVIQGVVTGIGFLGAGVIMREGFNISGLTTAASIWSSAAIGVLIGVGFYAAAILLAFLSMAAMMWGSVLERWLPSRQAVALQVHLGDAASGRPDIGQLGETLKRCGYQLTPGSLSIIETAGRPEWRFVAVERSNKSGASLIDLSAAVTAMPGVDGLHLSHARN
jgi:putative Mg2+ transporter-C (MgtC) family protein